MKVDHIVLTFRFRRRKRWTKLFKLSNSATGPLPSDTIKTDFAIVGQAISQLPMNIYRVLVEFDVRTRFCTTLGECLPSEVAE